LINWIKLKIDDTTQVIAPQWLAAVCAILVLLSGWLYTSDAETTLITAIRIGIVLFDIALVFYTLFPANYSPYSSFINEVIIAGNSLFLLVQVYLSDMNPEIAYFTLLSVYFIGQFTNHKSFFRYYPLLLFVVWYLIVVINNNPEINVYVLLLIAFVFSVAIFWINRQRIDLFEKLSNQKIAYQESNELFQSMFAKSPIGSALIDKNLYLKRVNNALCDVLGYDASRLSKMKIIDIATEEMMSVDRQIFKSIFSGNNQFYKTERRFIKKDGEAIWVNMSLSAISNENGEAVYTLMIAEDIGEQKVSETQIKQYADELEKCYKEIETLNLITSGNLQTPLREVSNYLDWLAIKKVKPEDFQMVDAIGHAKNSVDKIRMLISDLMQYAQIDRRKPRFTDVDIERLLEQVVNNLGELIEEKSAIVHYEDLPIILCDESDTRQVFQQLIKNAIVHCKGKVPIVKIGFMEDTDKWIFQVVDNGSGISVNEKERIFDLFYQMENRKNTVTGSTGIGLAMARKVINRVGGDIWVSSQEGVGSTFYFTIPKKLDYSLGVD